MEIGKVCNSTTLHPITKIKMVVHDRFYMIIGELIRYIIHEQCHKMSLVTLKIFLLKSM